MNNVAPPKKNYDPAILWPCLSAGLCVLHPLFIFLLSIVAFRYREPWIIQIKKQLSNYKWWYFGFPVFAFIIGYLNTMPFVLDDLMFHVVAYQFSYDFRSLYVHAAPLPNFNFWIGFEIFAGKLHQWFGPEYSIRIIQVVAAFLFYASFFLALNKIFKDRTDKWLWYTIIFALCVNPISYRVFLGRPDIFFTAWLLSAVFLRPLIWFLLGLIIMPTYSLAIIYAAGALLLDTTWRKKIVYGAAYSFCFVAFWYFYSHGEWFHIPNLISTWNKNRVIGISELLSSINILGNMYFIGLLAALYYFLQKSSFRLSAQAIPLVLLIIYFLLPGFIRYIIVLIPLTGLLCALYIPKDVKIPPAWSFVIFIFSLLIAARANPNIPYDALPKFKLPENAIVLTQFDEGIYSAILHSPHAKFAPAMEIGANDKWTQLLANSLRNGEPLKCEELKKLSFTHIQENGLRSIPPCLQLAQVDGSWRLWEIK